MFYINHQPFKNLDEHPGKFAPELRDSLLAIRNSYKVAGEDYPDVIVLQKIHHLALQELDNRDLQAIVLELTAFNTEISEEFDRLGIASKLLEIAVEFLEQGRYHLGNKSIIWDYAFAHFRWKLAEIPELEGQIAFLESHALLKTDEFLVPSLLNPILDRYAGDARILGLLLEKFGQFPPVSKKIDRLLRRL